MSGVSAKSSLKEVVERSPDIILYGAHTNIYMTSMYFRTRHSGVIWVVGCAPFPEARVFSWLSWNYAFKGEYLLLKRHYFPLCRWITSTTFDASGNFEVMRMFWKFRPTSVQINIVEYGVNYAQRTHFPNIYPFSGALLVVLREWCRDSSLLIIALYPWAH